MAIIVRAFEARILLCGSLSANHNTAEVHNSYLNSDMWMYRPDLRVRLARIFKGVSAIVIATKTATADHDRDDDSEYLSSGEYTAEIGNIHGLLYQDI